MPTRRPQPPSAGSPDDTLELFHPVIRGWFGDRLGSPTEVQALAWPRIAAGEHVVASAPTGSGKTLTAFLWALDRLLTGSWPGGRVRVLYVSPLRALNTDVRRNLERPLEELLDRFHAAGEAVPAVRALTRSGDTPQAERQRMLRRPPEILITTPESLNVLLTSEGGRSLLGDLRTVILDEIHAVAGSKRGVHLLTAVERLVPLSGEFQRLALSATLRPMATLAEMVGGREPVDGGGHRPRPVSIVHARGDKRYEVRVRYPATPGQELEEKGGLWELLARDFRNVIRRNRSTLLFANSRRLTERITRLLNEGEATDLAYSHHGSLSREVRSVVEERLKRGELKAIVATNSLELGIDVGALDEVILVQTPPSLSSAVQRIGRAGHGVGEVSRGRLYPTHGRDFLDAAVVARAVAEQEIEAVRPIEAPLDVLAQVILSMVATESWRIDDLYELLRSSYPYRHLERPWLERVLEMLAGRYADSRIRELHPRVRVDRVAGTVHGRPGSARLVYMGGGTIADRGYFALRLEDTMAKIGELDEEFVWERSVGDSFTLGAQSWQVRKVTHNDVLVRPARGSAGLAPFWRADGRDRDHYFARRVADFLAWIGERLEDPETPAVLERDHHLEPAAAGELLAFLRRQHAATGRLPTPTRLVAEHCRPVGRDDGRRQLILHNFWGGTVNRPLAVALQAAWEERYPEPAEFFHDDDCLMARLSAEVDAAELLSLVAPERIEELLRRRLERTGYFGARFRVNASTALLLPRAGFRTRTPLWMQRQRAKKLFASVTGYGDFPVLVETWRSCLRDELDLDALRRLLGEVASGEVAIEEVHTDAPSPFAANLIWRHTNQLMYEDDTPEGASGVPPAGVRPDLLRELVFASHLRPKLPASLVDGFRRKVQRTAPDYAPAPGDDLADWLRERILVPGDEWRELVAAVARDSETEPEAVVAGVEGRAVVVTLPGSAGDAVAASAVAAVDGLPRLFRALARASRPPAARPHPPTPLSPRERGAQDATATTLQPSSTFLPSPPGRGAGGEGIFETVPLRSLGDPEKEAPEAAERLRRLLAVETPDESAGTPDESADESAGTPDESAGTTPDEAAGTLLAEVIGEWLRYQGPIPPARVAAVFGLGEAALAEVLETLRDSQQVVIDQLSRGAEAPEVCDAENLEVLLRWLRLESRPSFEALPADQLPLFLAHHQGLTRPGDGIEGLQERLEKLLGLPAPAHLWETALLPARLAPYYPAWLDSLMQETELVWLGCGEKRLTFTFRSDLDLLREPEPADDDGSDGGDGDGDGGDEDLAGDLRRLFPDAAGRYDLGELADRTGLATAEVSDRLWRLAWAGRVTNDTFVAVRKGIASKFRPTELAAGRRRGRPRRRGAAARWQASRPFYGGWWPLPELPGPLDALEREELAKDRARLLLDRYGVLFRELLRRELPPLQWSRVFRALRLMELSGELLAGHFFRGVPGLQFISHGAFRELRRGLPEDAVYWLSAADSAAVAGVRIEGLEGELPARHATTFLVYHGARTVLVIKRRGRELDFRVGADHPAVREYVEVLKVLLTRQVRPLRSLEVETINGEPARHSPYCDPLGEIFRLDRQTRSIRLWKRY